MLLKFHNAKTRLIDDSVLLLRNTMIHLDYITANRIKRVITMNGFYKTVYQADRVSRLREIFRSRSRQLVLGASLFRVFNWEEYTVSAQAISEYATDIDTCHLLATRTLTCPSCGHRWKIDKPVDGIRYCTCDGAPSNVYGVATDEEGWVPFLERKDILVWRKEHPTLKGMYIYKMFGKFDDVTADEFMKVQLDLSEFRLSWDTSTAQCYVLEENKEKNQEVYYWEVNWPRFFSNRDYCCLRQTETDPETGTTVLVSRSVDHPNCPVKRKCLRVQDYDSVLAVKPFTSSDKPGVEFSLTGFENPGVALPERIITWVAIRGMPEFMQNLRIACTKLRNNTENTQSNNPSKRLNQCSNDGNINYNINAADNRMYA